MFHDTEQHGGWEQCYSKARCRPQLALIDIPRGSGGGLSPGGLGRGG